MLRFRELTSLCSSVLSKLNISRPRRCYIPDIPSTLMFHRCLVRKFEEYDGELHFLNETQTCSSWEFDTTYYEWTLVRQVSDLLFVSRDSILFVPSSRGIYIKSTSICFQFELVCDRSWYVSASQSAFMAGLMVGNIFFAKIADRWRSENPISMSSRIWMEVNVGYLISPSTL